MMVSTIATNLIYSSVANSEQHLNIKSMTAIDKALEISTQQVAKNTEMDKFFDENNVTVRNVDIKAMGVASDNQDLTYNTTPFNKSEDLSPKFIQQLQMIFNKIEKTRPDISKSNWDFTLMDGEFKVTSTKLSDNDKEWLTNSLNNDKTLLSYATDFTKLAAYHFETTKNNFSGTSIYNDYLKQDKTQIYYDVKTQIAEKFNLRDFFNKIYEIGKKINSNAEGLNKKINFSGIGKLSFDILEATSLTQSKVGIAQETIYLPVDETKLKAVPRSAPNTALLAQLYQTVGEQTEE